MQVLCCLFKRNQVLVNRVPSGGFSVEIAGAIALLAIVLAAYFLPTLIAGSGHPHRLAIFVINLFFGWTLLVWVGCIVWAVIQRKEFERQKL